MTSTIAINLPCVNCSAESYQGESNWMVVCCRAVFCAICIGYYLEDAECGGVCDHCQEPAADSAFQNEAQVDSIRQENEEQQLRDIALQSILAAKKRKDAAESQAIIKPAVNAEAEKPNKTISWDLKPTAGEPVTRLSHKRRIQSDFKQPNAKRIFRHAARNWNVANRDSDRHAFNQRSRHQDDRARVTWARCTAAAR